MHKLHWLEGGIISARGPTLLTFQRGISSADANDNYDGDRCEDQSFLTNQLLTNSQSTLHTWKIFAKGHICKNLFRMSSVFLQRICEGRVVEVAWSQRESGLDWKIKWQGPEIDHGHPGPSSPLSSWKEWRKSSTGEELLKYLREMDFFLCLSLSSELELPLRFQDPHVRVESS